MYGRWAHLETVGFEQWANASTVSMSASSVGAGDGSEHEPVTACLEVREVKDEEEGRSNAGALRGANMQGNPVTLPDGSTAEEREATHANSRTGWEEREGESRHRPILLRATWLTIGLLSLAAGAAGIVLPGLPTTPFIFLSAFCFARSSDRFLDCLTNSRLFGPILREWNENRALPSQRVKVGAIGFALVCFGASILYFAVWSPVWWVSIVFGVLCLLVCTFLVRLPVTCTASASINEDGHIETNGQ